MATAYTERRAPRLPETPEELEARLALSRGSTITVARCACDPPSIVAEPASQAQGMAAQLRTVAGIIEAPPTAPDPLLLHDPGIW